MQFLTATAFGDGGSGEETAWAQGPAGIAYATVGAPIGNTGQWSVQGAFGRGELSSWIVAGNYLRPTEKRHALDLGASFAMQGFSEEAPAALLSVPERRRVAGTIHAFDTWRLHRRAVVTYGTRYAYHDYLDRPTLMSPSASLSVSPIVVGLSLVLVYGGRQGWFGPALEDAGVQVIYATPGIVMATVFVALPLVIREVVPVLEEIGTDAEHAAQTLGANAWQTFWRITFPAIKWAVVYGVVLSLARSLGEFGAVKVVSGNILGETRTATLAVEEKYLNWEQESAYAIAFLLASVSVLCIIVVSLLRSRTERH